MGSGLGPLKTAGRRFVPILILAGAITAFLALRRERSFAGNYDGPVIITTTDPGKQFDCLGALLKDPGSFAVLSDAFSYGLIWHVATRPGGGGYEHSFLSGGPRRNSARVLSTSFAVVPEGGGFRISEPSYSVQKLGYVPAPVLLDQVGLEILRAAFNDSTLKRTLLDPFERMSLDIQTVCIQPSQSPQLYTISFSARPPKFEEPFKMTWYAWKDPRTMEYRFQYE